MRKRIVLIAAAYIRLREGVEDRQLPTFEAYQVNVKSLAQQYGFKNFTRIQLLTTELEKMIARRARIRGEHKIPEMTDNLNLIFQALGIWWKLSESPMIQQPNPALSGTYGLKIKWNQRIEYCALIVVDLKFYLNLKVKQITS